MHLGLCVLSTPQSCSGRWNCETKYNIQPLTNRLVMVLEFDLVQMRPRRPWIILEYAEGYADHVLWTADLRERKIISQMGSVAVISTTGLWTIFVSTTILSGVLRSVDWRPSIERARTRTIRACVMNIVHHPIRVYACFIYGSVMVGKPITLKRRSRHRNIGTCQVQT